MRRVRMNKTSARWILTKIGPSGTYFPGSHAGAGRRGDRGPYDGPSMRISPLRRPHGGFAERTRRSRGADVETGEARWWGHLPEEHPCPHR